MPRGASKTTEILELNTTLNIDLKRKYEHDYSIPTKETSDNEKFAPYAPDLVLDAFWDWVQGVNSDPKIASAADKEYSENKKYCKRLVEKYGNPMSDEDRNQNLLAEMTYMRDLQAVGKDRHYMGYDSDGKQLKREDLLSRGFMPPKDAIHFIEHLAYYTKMKSSSPIVDNAGNQLTAAYSQGKNFKDLKNAKPITDQPYLDIIDISCPNSEVDYLTRLTSAEEGINVMKEKPPYFQAAIEKMFRLKSGYFKDENNERLAKCKSQGSTGIDPEVSKGHIDLLLLNTLFIAQQESNEEDVALQIGFKGQIFAYRRDGLYEEQIAKERLMCLLSNKDIMAKFPNVKYINIYGQENEAHTSTTREVNGVKLSYNQRNYAEQFRDSGGKSIRCFDCSRGDPLAIPGSGNDNVIDINEAKQDCLQNFGKMLGPSLRTEIFGTESISKMSTTELQNKLKDRGIQHVFNVNGELNGMRATSSAHPLIYAFADYGALSRALSRAVKARQAIMEGKVLTEHKDIIISSGIVTSCNESFAHIPKIAKETASATEKDMLNMEKASGVMFDLINKNLPGKEGSFQYLGEATLNDGSKIEMAIGKSNEGSLPYMQVKRIYLDGKASFHRIDVYPGSIAAYSTDDQTNGDNLGKSVYDAKIKNWNDVKVNGQCDDFIRQCLLQGGTLAEDKWKVQRQNQDDMKFKNLFMERGIYQKNMGEKVTISKPNEPIIKATLVFNEKSKKPMILLDSDTHQAQLQIDEHNNTIKCDSINKHTKESAYIGLSAIHDYGFKGLKGIKFDDIVKLIKDQPSSRQTFDGKEWGNMLTIEESEKQMLDAISLVGIKDYTEQEIEDVTIGGKLTKIRFGMSNPERTNGDSLPYFNIDSNGRLLKFSLGIIGTENEGKVVVFDIKNNHKRVAFDDALKANLSEALKQISDKKKKKIELYSNLAIHDISHDANPTNTSKRATTTTSSVVVAPIVAPVKHIILTENAGKLSKYLSELGIEQNYPIGKQGVMVSLKDNGYIEYGKDNESPYCTVSNAGDLYHLAINYKTGKLIVSKKDGENDPQVISGSLEQDKIMKKYLSESSMSSYIRQPNSYQFGDNSSYSHLKATCQQFDILDRGSHKRFEMDGIGYAIGVGQSGFVYLDVFAGDEKIQTLSYNSENGKMSISEPPDWQRNDCNKDQEIKYINIFKKIKEIKMGEHEKAIVTESPIPTKTFDPLLTRLQTSIVASTTTKSGPEIRSDHQGTSNNPSRPHKRRDNDNEDKSNRASRLRRAHILQRYRISRSSRRLRKLLGQNNRQKLTSGQPGYHTRRENVLRYTK